MNAAFAQNIGQSFLIKSEDLRKAIAPYSEILKMGIKTWKQS